MNIIQEYIDWLINSRPGDTAVAPFTKYDILRRALDDTANRLRQIQGIVIMVSPVNGKLQIEGRGKIDFIVTEPENLRGRNWDKAFAIVGPERRDREYSDFRFRFPSHINRKV